MKKILAILAMVSITSAPASGVVSCSRPFSVNRKIPDDEFTDKTYRENLNYQSGPSSSASGLNKNLSNSFITTFNVGSESTYSAYNIGNGKVGYKNPVFFGDKDQFLKTSDDKFIPSGWRNDQICFQNVLAFHKNLQLYRNISLSISDTTTSNDKPIDNNEKLTGKIQIEKYMLTNRHDTSSINDSIMNARQYVPDALMGNHMNSLAQQVSVDNFNTSSDVYFDIWNSWITLSSTDKTLVGNHDMTLSINFDYDGKHVAIEKKQKVSVKKYLFNKNDIDENKDGIIDYRDRFGLSASTFPVNGIKDWNSDIYSKLPNYVIAEKMGSKSWTSDLLKKEINGKNVEFDTEYISNGSQIDTTAKDGIITFSTKNNKLRFDAFIVVKVDGKSTATLSVYYNEFGQPTYAFIYNDQKSLVEKDGKQLKNPDDIIDINGDGVKDDKDWDIDGDGKYTREDYAASGDTDKDGNFVPDEIGPNANYADWVRRKPLTWSELDKDISPLQDTNSLYISGTGTHKQLIQYTGKLDDSSLSSKFNGSKSGPADDYEKALIDANKSANAFTKFITSRQGHKWTWNFDFTNLDMYMRLAASKNIPEVLINPVDVGGFSFWYLKGKDAKLGAQRDMLKASSLSLINTANGKISATGQAFTNNIVSELAKQLSKHLANDLQNNPAYKTANGENVKIFFSFDEDNEQTIDYVMNVVNNNSVDGGKIYSSCYLGWRSDISNDRFDSKTLLRDLNDDNMDQIIFVYRVIINGANNSDLLSIRQKIVNRAKKGKLTLFYTTYDAYPGGYCQSDLSNNYWQMLFAYRLGMNGYARWAWDDTFSNYYDSSVIDYNQHLIHVSGQSFLVYDGSDSDGIHYSTRLLSYINAVNYVYKIKQILHNTELFNVSERIETGLALESIGFSPLKFNNNNWKYNIYSGTVSDNFGMITDDDTTTVSEQVHKIIAYIDSL